MNIPSAGNIILLVGIKVKICQH